MNSGIATEASCPVLVAFAGAFGEGPEYINVRVWLFLEPKLGGVATKGGNCA